MSAEILVVDDTPANVNVLRAMLEEEHYDVAVATSGELALRIAEKIRPALILLDVMMPGMDGYETCRSLKAREETQRIPVIFITARTEIQDILDGFNVGAIDYVAKPFKREEVLARVRSQVQLHLSNERLHIEAERFRAIVNNISDALIICDSVAQIRLANPAALHLLQRQEQELQQQDIGVLLPTPYAESYRSAFAGKSELPFGAREIEGVRADDGKFAMDFTVSQVFLEEPLFIGIFRDISVRKDAEANLQILAATDALTNLANRRTLEHHLQLECARAKRQREPLSVLMIDVDHFKAYNDHYGHQQGDRCLVQVARVLQTSAVRGTDIVARYGGEEFVILLPNTNAEGAQKTYARLAELLADAIIHHERSSVGSHVTVSCGIATCEQGAIDSGHDLMLCADRALYQAKAQGRNRAVLSLYGKEST